MSSAITHKDFAIEWFKRSIGKELTVSTLDPFVYLWFSFNAWASHRANSYLDKEMWQWFARDDQANRWYSFLIKSDNDFVADLRRLEKIAVQDMRDPGNTRKEKELRDIESLFELMDVIYRVRCNLFHGHKSMEDPHDVELVQCAYRILLKIYRPFAEEMIGRPFPRLTA